MLVSHRFSFSGVLSFLLFCSMVSIFAASAKSETTAESLPAGTAPEPETVPHFPDRLHAFVWRNWNLVPLEKLAKILKTDPENVAEIASSMGLPSYRVPGWSTQQIYITLIRRNWHLLPYDQMLELVEMTPERFAFALQEDDFLWIKLGLLKPKCEPILYLPPGETAKRHAAEIARILKETLGDAVAEKNAVPRFAFIDDLRRVSGGAAGLPADGKADRRESPRFIYSYFALYGDPLSGDDVEVFPDGLLEKLNEMKVNGVWMHVVLREMAPGGGKFPEFGHGCEKRLENLRKLVERAGKYGIGIYLYLNEPRSMPSAFFEKPDIPGRRETAGVSWGTYSNLCISHPDVQDWMRDAVSHIFREVPDLAGVFTISGSENHTHCNSHGRWKDCPKCREKTGAQVTAEANALIAEGVHRAAPDAKVILWDWGWNGHGKSLDIIERLPDDVWLMSVSEWALPITRGGISSAVGEYSISSVGPGPRATEHWQAAKRRGLKTVAKMQINCTWEIAAVPYVPVMDLVAEHCSKLKNHDVDGMMFSWTLGGYPSPNLEIPKMFDREPAPAKEEVLDALAVKRYGKKGAARARRAWTMFSDAYREYPYAGGVIYNAPVQIGPANLFRPEPSGFSATMVGIPYDDLNAWCGGLYPPAVFAAQFGKMAEGFSRGIAELAEAVEAAPVPFRKEARAELRYAEVCRIHFASVANQVRYILLRNESLAPETDERRKDAIRRETDEIVRNEAELARELYLLTLEDSSIGFESSNHYFYVPNDLLEKIVQCRLLSDDPPHTETKEK